MEVLAFVHDGLKRGAVGVNLGRNIWQSPNPVPMIRALGAIIHEKASVKQALDLFQSVKADAGKARRKK
jgi:putative autoinducer-2 (AI-2) aldolase